MNPIYTGMLTGAILAIGFDLDAFMAARKLNKRAKFDWVLCLARVAKGIIGGTGLGAGFGVMESGTVG